MLNEEKKMEQFIEIKQALEIWADNCFEILPHISMERLYQMSMVKGLKNADKSEIEHLSLCPECLSTWEICADMNNMEADEYENNKTNIVLGWGFLEAASDDFIKPLYIKSSCKKFMLGIFPEYQPKYQPEYQPKYQNGHDIISSKIKDTDIYNKTSYNDLDINSTKGLATIEVISDNNENLEGMIISVKDAAGNKFLSKKIKDKRAATKIDNLNLLDLSVWTIVISKFKEDNE